MSGVPVETLSLRLAILFVSMRVADARQRSSLPRRVRWHTSNSPLHNVVQIHLFESGDFECGYAVARQEESGYEIASASVSFIRRRGQRQCSHSIQSTPYALYNHTHYTKSFARIPRRNHFARRPFIALHSSLNFQDGCCRAQGNQLGGWNRLADWHARQYVACKGRLSTRGQDRCRYQYQIRSQHW